MRSLSGFVGTWAGTNGFRLLPADPLAEFAAAATVTAAAGGNLTSVAYRWRHPDDGPQDGLVVVWAAGEDGALAAVWGDSWHQQPAPMSLSGSQDAAGTVELAAGYGDGWGWRIGFDTTDPDHFRIRMDNVVPVDQATAEFPAGPYPAMVMQLRRH